VLSEEGEGWEGDRGRVRKELLEKYFRNEEDGKFAAVCGPKGLPLHNFHFLFISAFVVCL
jgi:hypothetical protein